MNFATLNKQRKMILIAAAVGVISMFLPWVSFLGFSTNGMNGWGVLVFFCFAGAGVISLMGDQTRNLEPMNWMLTLIAGGVAGLIMVINFFNAIDALGYLSIGFYGALVAAVALPAFAYMYRTANDSLQSGFDTLKNNFNAPSQAKDRDTNSTTKVINPSNDPSKPVV